MTKKRPRDEASIGPADDQPLEKSLLTNDNEESETKRKKKSKKRKKENNKDGKGVSTPEPPVEAIVAEENNYPYEVIDDDHCESPFEAYRDIAPLLNSLLKQLNKETLSIYDPYYCEGQMKKHLNNLGFNNVYNEKEDFYLMKQTNQLPPYDVLITNPPYSLDHMSKLLDHVSSDPQRRPFCLLLPNYVYMKDYFINSSCSKSTKMFFIAPSGNRRYMYTTPKGRRQQKSAHYTSPFPTFWYCGNFHNPEVMKEITQYGQQSLQRTGEGIVVAKNIYQLPLESCPDQDPRKKKLRNNLKRKKNKAKKKATN